MATGVSRGRVLRKWGGPARRPPPIRAVALAVQSIAAARPLLLAHLLPLHGFSQEAVIVIIPAAPGAAARPVTPLQIHQIVTAAAASPWEGAVATPVSSPAIIGGVVTTPAVVEVVSAAGAAAPPVIRAKETESSKLRGNRNILRLLLCNKISC